MPEKCRRQQTKENFKIQLRNEATSPYLQVKVVHLYKTRGMLLPQKNTHAFVCLYCPSWQLIMPDTFFSNVF